MPTTDWGGGCCAEATEILEETEEMRIAPRKMNCITKLKEEKEQGGLGVDLNFFK